MPEFYNFIDSLFTIKRSGYSESIIASNSTLIAAKDLWKNYNYPICFS